MRSMARQKFKKGSMRSNYQISSRASWACTACVEQCAVRDVAITEVVLKPLPFAMCGIVQTEPPTAKGEIPDRTPVRLVIKRRLGRLRRYPRCCEALAIATITNGNVYS